MSTTPSHLASHNYREWTETNRNFLRSFKDCWGMMRVGALPGESPVFHPIPGGTANSGEGDRRGVDFETAHSALHCEPPSSRLAVILPNGLFALEVAPADQPSAFSLSMARTSIHEHFDTYMERGMTLGSFLSFGMGEIPADMPRGRTRFEDCVVQAYGPGDAVAVTGEKVGPALYGVAYCQKALDWLAQALRAQRPSSLTPEPTADDRGDDRGNEPHEAPASGPVASQQDAAANTAVLSWDRPSQDWPAEPRDCAYHGLAGEIVNAIFPYTEAAKVALLILVLTMFGSVIGRSAFFLVNSTKHFLNLFFVLVGRTAAGRKGTAHDAIEPLFRRVDPYWAANCLKTGLSSGEGLIYSIRDPVWRQVAVRDVDGNVESHEELVDEGVADKRLLAVQPEFSLVLKMCQREGNVLSDILRALWDCKSVATMTKNPMTATDPHISLEGHTSKEEAALYLTTMEAASGFGNRFLWPCVHRSKLLPEGRPFPSSTIDSLVERLRTAVEFARTVGEMTRDAEAAELWASAYPRLTDRPPGMYGSMTARAAPQTLRLSCLFALLDRSREVRRVHLEAALELWRYCDDSVRHVFGARLGDPRAERILRALQDNEDGLTRSEINNLFQRNVNAGEIDRALRMLREFGMAEMRREPTGGRPVERWLIAEG